MMCRPFADVGNARGREKRERKYPSKWLERVGERKTGYPKPCFRGVFSNVLFIELTHLSLSLSAGSWTIAKRA